jgi:DNA adenine methylase
MDDQQRLKETCDRLTQRGVMFLQSNSYCDAVLDLYKGYSVDTVMMKRSINSKADGRGAVKEVLIRNY